MVFAVQYRTAADARGRQVVYLEMHGPGGVDIALVSTMDPDSGDPARQMVRRAAPGPEESPEETPGAASGDWRAEPFDPEAGGDVPSGLVLWGRGANDRPLLDEAARLDPDAALAISLSLRKPAAKQAAPPDRPRE